MRLSFSSASVSSSAHFLRLVFFFVLIVFDGLGGLQHDGRDCLAEEIAFFSAPDAVGVFTVHGNNGHSPAARFQDDDGSSFDCHDFLQDRNAIVEQFCDSRISGRCHDCYTASLIEVGVLFA